jgi:autotransporter translocation and assembly factor TamB
MKLMNNQQNVFKFDTEIPVHLSFSDFNLEVPETEQFSIRIVADSLPVDAVLGRYLEHAEVKGVLQSDFKMSNTIKNPKLNGHLKIDQGTVRLEKYGINYGNIQLHIKADSNRIVLENLKAWREKGYLEASGYLSFNKNLISGEIASTNFQLLAKDFYLAQNKNFEIQINADTEVQGTGKSAEFEGTIEVSRSSFYMPAVREQFSGKPIEENPDKPLLVKTLEESEPATENGAEDMTESAENQGKTPAFFERLTGRLKLSIPRNTWLKGPNILMELEGNLDLVKQETYFELFGQIGIVRGHYTLIGKRFNILEGNLKFKGGKELNPDIVLTAEYEIRTATKEKKALRLFISGSVDNPSFRFTLDGSDITRADAVSYIAFGKSTEELSFGEQAGMERSALAMDFATSVLSKELSKSLGQELQLDYLEIKGKDNWESATFVVGKYITNELFVSYQREFGDTKDNDIAPETVTVEYELTRNIFFQLIEGDSKAKGVDVIFKLEF